MKSHNKMAAMDVRNDVLRSLLSMLSIRDTFSPILGAALCLGLIMQALPVWAQNRNAGEIRGSVVDSTGAAIPDVSVEVTNTATAISLRAVTNSAGQYDLPYVSAGDYTVTFTRDGFETSIQRGITLHIEAITVNATLQVGSVTTAVTVTTAPSLLQTETSELSSVLTSESISQLPLVGGNWQTFTELLPGVTPVKGGSTTSYPNSASGQNISVNGSQAFQSSWLLEGGAATLPTSYNPDLLAPPTEAIQEVDLTTSTFGADSGNGLSSFNVILKSGTNRFHGSLFEYLQNDVLNASPRNWSSAPQPKPPVRWNMFGGTVGGPIIRDKLFFFFAYQNNPVRTYTHSLYTYPTDDMRKGDFSNSAFAQIYNPATTTQVGNTFTRTPFPNNQITTLIDPVAANIQQFFPEPNAIDPSNPYFNNYYFSAAQPSNQHWYVGKVDGNLSPKNHIYGSILPTTITTTSPSPDCPIDCTVNTINEIAGQVTDAWSFTDKTLNEFRISVARETGVWIPGSLGKGYPAQIGLPQLPADTFPVVNTSSGPSITIGGSSLQAALAETSVVVSDTFNWVLGKHDVKIGGEYDNWTDNLGWETLEAGTFNFSGIATRDPNSNDPNASAGVGYADFLLGATQSWSVTLPPATGGYTHNVQLYAQDYYKVRSNLTLNYGLRFIYQNGWKEKQNRIANYDPTLINPATGNPGALGFAGIQIPSAVQAGVPFISPRLGFAWTVRPSWVVRGGFGFYQIPWSGNGYLIGVGTGWTTQGSEQSADSVNPIFQLASGPPAPIVPTAASRTPTLLNGQNVSYTPYHTPMSYFEEWQASVEHQFGQYAVQAAYVGSVGRKLPFNTDVNQVLQSELGSGLRPNPTYQQISGIRYSGESNYNALQLTGKRQFNNGLYFVTNYTWAKNLDTGTGSGGNGPSLDYWQNAYSTALNYGASANDVRQSVNGGVLYQLPFGRNRKYANNNAIADAVIGGWQLGTTFQAHSGLPFTPVMANNLSGALSGTWLPNRTGRITVSNPSVNEWFNVNAFTAPAPSTFGDSGRNILYGPHFVDVDLTLAKSFAIPMLGDASNFQIRADVFDVLNHPNYGQPNATIGSPGAGIISSSTTNRILQIDGIFRF